MSFFRDSGSTKVKVRGYLIVEQGVNKGGKEALGLSWRVACLLASLRLGARLLDEVRPQHRGIMIES